MINIAFFLPGFASAETDDNNNPFIQSYIKGLLKHYPEIKITIFAFQYPFNKKEYYWNGIKVYSANGKNKSYLKIITWFKIKKNLID